MDFYCLINEYGCFENAFQDAVVDVLAEKTTQAAAVHTVTAILLSGGVSANLALRAEVRARAGGIPVHYSPVELCTDNAAMIAAAGFHKLKMSGGRWDLDFDAISRWPDLPGYSPDDLPK